MQSSNARDREQPGAGVVARTVTSGGGTGGGGAGSVAATADGAGTTEAGRAYNFTGLIKVFFASNTRKKVARALRSNLRCYVSSLRSLG